MVSDQWPLIRISRESKVRAIPPFARKKAKDGAPIFVVEEMHEKQPQVLRLRLLCGLRSG